MNSDLHVTRDSRVTSSCSTKTLSHQNSDQERDMVTLPPMNRKKKRGKFPAWSQTKFTPPKERKARPVQCALCGRIAIPQAYFEDLKFCTFAHGKEYLRKRRDKKAGTENT